MPKEELKAILLVLLLAAGLRFAGITFDSLWLDEAYQTLASSVGQRLPDFTRLGDQAFLFHFGPPRPVNELLANFRQVDPLCPPLYPVLLNRWMALFGQSDLSVRSLSAVVSLLSIGAVYWCARLAFGARAALLSALLQAVSPFDIHYAQEARMYSLTVLLSTLSCGTFLVLLRSARLAGRTTIALGGYAVSTWALINSHYTALFIPLFQGLFGTVYCLKNRYWRLLGVLGVAWAAVLALWLPWFEMFRQAAAVRKGTFYVARSPSWSWPIYSLLIRLPLNWLVFLAGKKVVAYAVPIYLTSASLLALAATAILPGGLNRLAGRPSAPRAPDGPASSGLETSVPAVSPERGCALETSFIGCWALLPALFVWLTDVIENHRVIEIARYVSATAPAIYVLAGAGLAAVLSRSGSVGATGNGLHEQPSGARGGASRSAVCSMALCILLLHVLFALVNNAYAHVVPQREPWREMAAQVESLCAADDPILVSQYYDIVCLDRYLRQPRIQIGISPAQGNEHIARLIGSRPRFWLLTAQEGEEARELIPAGYRPTREVHLSHGLHLRLYELAH
ncbi:MAG TPA: glycosyltransferase family 39 protein [Candidatus Obscuribacterales bacterium]